MNAQEQLVSHAAFVRNLAQRLVEDEDRAEDVIQDTWLAALEHPPRYQKSLQAWLGTVLANFVKRSGRSEVRTRKREHRVARPDLSPSSVEVLEKEAMLRRVVQAVFDLEPPYRSVIILRFYDDLPPREIARKLDLPVETIRTRLKRGLQQLRGRLDRDYGDRSAWTPILLASLDSHPLFVGTAFDPRSGPGALVSSSSTSSEPSDPTSDSPLTPRSTPLGGIGFVGLLILIPLLVWLGFRALDRSEIPDDSTTLGIETAELPAPSSTGNPPNAIPTHRNDLLDSPPKPEETISPSPTAPGSLRLSVRFSEDETPAANISIGLLPGSPFLARGHRMTHRTNAEGELYFPEVEPGEHTVFFDRAIACRTLPIEADDERVVTFSLPPGLRVRGTVVDESGRPVVGAKILFCRLFRFQDSGVVLAVTDSAGAYTIRSLSCPGFLGAFSEEWAPSEMIRLPEGSRETFIADFELKSPGIPLRGRILDPSGNPVPEAEVLLEPWLGTEIESLEAQKRLFPPFRTLSDPKGRFQFQGLPVGKAKIFATSTGVAPLVRDVDLRPGEEFLTLAFTAGSRLSGRVLDRGGKGVAAVTVTAVSKPLEGLRAPMRQLTDENGAYRFEGLPAGSLTLRANQGGVDVANHSIEVDATSSAIEVDLQIEQAERIHGRLLDFEGNALESWRIEAVTPIENVETHSLQGRDGTSRLTVATDAKGRFAIEGCQARPYRIHVYSPEHVAGYPALTVGEVDPGGGELLLSLRQDHSNSARFKARISRDDNGRNGPLTFLMKPLREPWCLAFAYAVSEATFTTPDPLVPGEYRIALSTPLGGSWILGDFDLEQGETLDLGTLSVRPPGSLRVAIITPEEEAEAGADLRVWLHDAYFERRMTLIRNGSEYVSSQVPQGTYFLSVSSPRHADLDRQIEIVAGEKNQTEMRLEPGSPRLLRFREPAGVPWSRQILLTARNAIGQSLWTRRLDRSGLREFWIVCSFGAGLTLVEAQSDAGLRGEIEIRIESDQDPSSPVPHQNSTPETVTISLEK